MRPAFLCLLCNIYTHCFCQDSIDKAPLHFDSYGFNFYVTPKEKPIIVTRAGEIAYANDLKSLWHKAFPEGGSKSPIAGLTLDNVNFFNNDTGFVSGFIYGGGKYDIIYHTTDGGTTWQPVVFGKGGWVDDAVNLDNGEAWMSVSGDGIYYTNDYGFKWQYFKNPEPKQRFAKICFNTAKEGLIGSLYNLLAYTPDNCKTWQFLPTPFDQKAYVKTSKGNRPEINRLAILPGIFLLRQEDLVFWSKRDKIEWKLLKGYDDFYTDVSHSAVYFKKGSSTIIKADVTLNVVSELKLNSSISSAHCVNGKLFVFSGTEICEIDDNSVHDCYPLLTTDKRAVEPAYIGYAADGTYGNIGSKIYKQKDYGAEWTYAFTLPFAVDGGALTMKNDLLLYSKGDSLLYYSVQTGLTDYVSRKQLFSDFAKQPVTEITFETGSRGCFHGFKNMVTYQKICDDFELISEDEEEKRAALPKAPELIESAKVDTLMLQLPNILTTLPTIKTLNISDRDYQQCRADILAFKNAIGSKKEKETKFFMTENNIDFDRLLSLVDSVKLLTPERLNNMLYNLSEIWSTTTNWTSMSFTNAKGQKLTITNSYYESNSLCLPWYITLNGYSINLNSLAVTGFVKACYPALIGKTSNVDILYRLVKQMYAQE